MNAAAVGIVLALASQVHLTPEWLAGQGPGPYYLSQPGATYILESDVTTRGTAFIVQAPDVTLDLNGHTVTYDNARPIIVPNGGFERGSGPADIPDWDLTRAPGAVRALARAGMWGGWMLHLPEVKADTTLVSGEIAIPRAGEEYAAMITPKTSGGPSVTLSVVDAATGGVLASARAKDPDRGFSAVARFTPTTTRPVRLAVAIAPAKGRAGPVDLDYAAVYRVGHHGVVATPSPWTLPPHLQAALSGRKGGKPARFTIRGGSLIQGAGDSYSASAVYAMSSDGIVIDRVRAEASGPDTNILELTYAANPSVVGCRLVGRLDRISDRMKIFAAIRLANTSGPVRVEGNAIVGRMHTGIILTRQSGATVPIRIVGNTIEHEALVTDGYGIFLNGVRRFEIARNAIRPVNGRGLMLDTFSRAVTEGGRVVDNIVEARERQNLEYEAKGLEAVALTVRVFDGGAVRGVAFEGNTFSGRTGPGGVWATAGARVAIDNRNTQMADSGLVFRGNRFRAVIEAGAAPGAAGPRSGSAWGLSLAAVPAGTGLRFLDNEFASNDVSLNLGDNTGYNGVVADVLFAGSTIRRLVEGASVPHRGVVVGEWRNGATGVRLLDTRYDDGADTRITFLGEKPKDVEVGRLLGLSVSDVDGSPASEATVRLLDEGRRLVYEGRTDERGALAGIPLITTIYRQVGDKPGSTSVTRRDRWTVVASRGGREASLALSEPADDRPLRIRLP